MAVLDTSLLLALMDGDHAHHDAARDLAAGAPRWTVTPGVLGEFTQMIRQQANARGLNGNEQARRLLAELERADPFRCVSQHDPAFTSRIYQTNPSLSYVDAWGIALALDQGDDLLTLDRKQSNVHERLR